MLPKTKLATSLIGVLLFGQIVITPPRTTGTTVINNTFNNVTNTSGNFVSQGCQVIWISGYIFSVSSCTYYIENVQYSFAGPVTVTLDAADATNPRLDVIVANTAQTATFVKGTAAADPSVPSIDPGSQLQLSIVLVGASTTQPAAVANTVIYNDNAGSPTEWDCTDVGTGFVCNSTTNPKSPSTTDIEGTNVPAGDLVQLQIGSGSVDLSTVDSLVLFIRSKATWGNGRGLQVGFFSSGVLKGQQIQINRTGTWGFISNQTSTYQQIVIPINNFTIPLGTTVNQLRIAGFGGAIGMYIDDIFLQGGNAVPIPAPVPIRAAFQAGICQNTTAVAGFSLPTSNPAVAACVTGTNTQYAVMQYADASNLSVQAHIPLVDDWAGITATSALVVSGKWRTSATSGNVVWQVATICVGDANTGDPAFNTSSTVIDAAKGTTLQYNDFSIANVIVTGCTPGEELYLKFFRDAGHASDNLAATAELLSLLVTLQRQ